MNILNFVEELEIGRLVRYIQNEVRSKSLDKLWL
jgi:hypothetical protein